MKCAEIRETIRENIRQGSDPGEDDAVVSHVRHCELCRSLYNDAVLSCALKGMPVPAMRPGFETAAIQHAVKRNRRKRRVHAFVSAAAAAVLVVAISLGLFFERSESERHAGLAPDTEVSYGAAVEQTLRILIDAADYRADAALSIDLDENVALKDYPGQRRLEWRTDIARGRNLLELPVVLTGGDEGMLRIRYQYNGSEQEMSFRIRAENENGRIRAITS